MHEAMTKVTIPGYSRRLKKKQNEWSPEFSQPIVDANLNSEELKFSVVSCSLSSLNRVSFHQNTIFKGETTPVTSYI